MVCKALQVARHCGEDGGKVKQLPIYNSGAEQAPHLHLKVCGVNLNVATFCEMLNSGIHVYNRRSTQGGDPK